MEPVQKRMRLRSHGPKIVDLPNEILEMIFLKLSRYDILHNLALVCRRFLNITRRSIFVPCIAIGDSFIGPGINFPECYLEKIEKVKKVYPKCNILLNCLLESGEQGYILPGYSWMKRFQPYDSSITKMSLRLEHNWQRQDTSDFLDFLFLENLECLYLDVSLTDWHRGSLSIQDVEAGFWNNFPHLKRIEIRSSYCELCPIPEFIDKICSTCRNLEYFLYEGGYPGPMLLDEFPSKISDQYPKVQFKDEDKFPKLDYIKIKFYVMDINKEHEDKPIMENFQKYLTAKCPNLKNPILMEHWYWDHFWPIKVFEFESKCCFNMFHCEHPNAMKSL